MSPAPAHQVAAPPAASGTSSPAPAPAGEAFWTSLEEDLRERVGARYQGRAREDFGRGDHVVDVLDHTGQPVRYRGATMRDAFLSALAGEGARRG